MNEIERAIELLEEISYNIGLERDTEFAGDAEKFDMLCGKKELIDVATEICRAELARQDAKPLTCDGCKYESEELEPMCHFCMRTRSGRYEPKGEKA